MNCNRETTKLYLPIMLRVGIESMTAEKWLKKWSTNQSTNVSNLQKEVAKWSGVSPALSWRFFHHENPRNKDGLTPLLMAIINIIFLNCTANKKSKNKDGLTLLHMAAVQSHFRNFQ